MQTIMQTLCDDYPNSEAKIVSTTQKLCADLDMDSMRDLLEQVLTRVEITQLQRKTCAVTGKVRAQVSVRGGRAGHSAY
jgi:hypothetical protein